MKTFIKEATILSVYDFHENEKVFIGDTIYGVVTQDETEQLPTEHRVISTTIEKQNELEFVTKKGAVFVCSGQLILYTNMSCFYAANSAFSGVI